MPLDKDTLERTDLVVILVPQTGVDWDLVASAPMVLDCCRAVERRRPNVQRL